MKLLGCIGLTLAVLASVSSGHNRDEWRPVVDEKGCGLLNIADAATRRQTLLDSVRKYCSDPSHKAGSHYHPTSRFLVSKPNRLLIAVNPKVMSSSTKLLLAALEHRDTTKVKTNDLSQFTFFSNLPHDEQVEVLRKYHRVAFVRNPYTRTYSAWHNKFQTMYQACHLPNNTCGGMPHMWIVHANTIHDHLGYPRPASDMQTLGNVTWPMFLHSVLSGWVADRHWRPQVEETALCWFKPTYIGMQEFADEDVHGLLQEVGVNPDEYAMPQRNAGKSHTDFTEVYDPVRRLQFQWMYRFDFLAMGYPRNPQCANAV